MIVIRLKGYPQRAALPGWRGAFGIGIGVTARFTRIFFQDQLAAADLCHHRIQFFAVIRNTTIGDVVAIPAGCRVKRIELGQIQLRDASGQAIDQQPASPLPLPARTARIGISAGAFPLQGIIYAKRPTIAGRILLDPRVHQERSHFEVEHFFAGRIRPFGGGPFAERDDVRLGYGYACGTDDQNRGRH